MSLAENFLSLHLPGRPLLMPNAWDAGSAKVLASLGFSALATTSISVGGAFAFAALGAVKRAAEELLGAGTTGYSELAAEGAKAFRNAG